MNNEIEVQVKTVSETVSIGEAIDSKALDMNVPGAVVEFSPEEAEQAGFFVEDALSEEDAYQSTIDAISNL